MEKEKCVYCEEGKEKLLPIDYSNTDFGLLMDDENCVMLSYQDCEYAAYRPKFCPECGRKLSDIDD